VAYFNINNILLRTRDLLFILEMFLFSRRSSCYTTYVD